MSTVARLRFAITVEVDKLSGATSLLSADGMSKRVNAHRLSSTAAFEQTFFPVSVLFSQPFQIRCTGA